jgi:microcystin degradation protein MlrC
MAMAKVPVVTGAIRGSTEWGDPFGRVMQFGKAFEARRDVLSVSVFMVHPNLDLPSLGSGGLVITDGDPALAEELARRIAEQYWSLRHELEPEVHSPGAATAAALAAPGGPHILVETADCCGGGAAGDSAASLKALLRAEVAEASLVPIVDAEAARACHAAGVGKTISLQLGHRHDPKWGEPVQVTGKVARLSDGRFVYTGGIWGGVEGNMGLTAVLQIGAISVLIASNPTYDWADEQYRSVGLDPAAAKIVVAKNPMNYRMAYEGCAKGFFVLDTPGPTPPTVRHYPYRNLARPYFPVDTEIPGLRPTVYRSLRCT